MTGTRDLRVLHVVVGAGSGVVAVVEDHIANTPEHEHHALVALDEDCAIGPGLRDLAGSVAELPRSSVACALALRAGVERLDPDVIHAHSSFAGAFARAVLPRRRRRQVVFTPHGYAFERTDVAPWTRTAFRLAESALSFRGAHVAACGPREAELASGLPGRQQVTYVPNVARGFTAPPASRPRPPTGRLVAATSGRITAAKAPDVFAEAARRSRDRDLGIDWMWVGGDPARPGAEDDLRRAGVQVTGWIPRDDARRRLATADVYVHCASWEGAPLTVLEAAVAGVPVVARRTAALEALGVEPLYETVDELLAILLEFPGGPAFATARACIVGLRDRHTSERQRAALMDVYRRAAGARARSRRRP